MWLAADGGDRGGAARRGWCARSSGEPGFTEDSPIRIRALRRIAHRLGPRCRGRFSRAHWLGPARYGDAQFVLLLYLYATLIRSGVFEGSVRSVIDHLARGEEKEAREAQNVGVSYELVVSALPGVPSRLSACSSLRERSSSDCFSLPSQSLRRAGAPSCRLCGRLARDSMWSGRLRSRKLSSVQSSSWDSWRPWARLGCSSRR